MRDQPARMMERADFHQHIGDANLAPAGRRRPPLVVGGHVAEFASGIYARQRTL
jgi:hypothetical protein